MCKTGGKCEESQAHEASFFRFMAANLSLTQFEARRRIMCKRYSTKSRTVLLKSGRFWGMTPWLPVSRLDAAVCAPLV